MCFCRHDIWIGCTKPNSEAKPATHSSTVDKYYKTTTVLPSVTQGNIKQAVVKWIITDCRPLTITSDEGFKELLRTATGCQSYVPPCYATITESIHQMYVEKKIIVKERLAAACAVSLTADFWTSIQNRSYIGVTVHFIEQWLLKSFVLDVLEVSESHTAEVCGRTLENVANEWEIAEKVMVIVTDRGRNIVKGIEQHTPFLNTNCLAHILQRGIVAGFKASGMDGLFVKCRKIVGHFKHSSLQTARLNEASQELQLSNLVLIQDITTRRFSVLAMAERLVSKKAAIEQVLDENGWSAENRLSDAEYGRLEQIIKLLGPLKELSDRLGGEKYITGSVQVHAVRKLEQFLIPSTDDPMYISSFKKAFSSYMAMNIQLPPVVKTCAALDPRFKKLKGINEKHNNYLSH